MPNRVKSLQFPCGKMRLFPPHAHRDGNTPHLPHTARQACPATSTCPCPTQRWNPAPLPASLGPTPTHTPAPRGVPRAAPRPQHGHNTQRSHPPSSPWAPSWPGGSRKGSPVPRRTGLYPQISREQNGNTITPPPQISRDLRSMPVVVVLINGLVCARAEVSRAPRGVLGVVVWHAAVPPRRRGGAGPG